MLVGVLGKRRETDAAVLRYACRHPPALVIDCGNAADPHALFPAASAEQLERVRSVPIDLLYQLRDAARILPELVGDARLVVVTSPYHLFNYHDEEENTAVEQHAWELLAKHGKRLHILVSVPAGTRHERWARRYCERIHALDKRA